MKAGTTQKLKFRKLARRLCLNGWGAMGILESLWHATASNAPEGDIGRYSNEDIATLIDWDGDADELIDALAETGWLARCSNHRLVVHDWGDHAPNYLKANLARHNKQFVVACPVRRLPVAVESSSSRLQGGGEEAAQAASAATTKPSQAKPSQAKPIKHGHSGRMTYSAKFCRWWTAYPRKIAKGAAAKAFAKLPADVDLDTLQEITALFSASFKGRGPYCPHPATWLNNRCWEDDQTEWQDRNGSASQHQPEQVITL